MVRTANPALRRSLRMNPEMQQIEVLKRKVFGVKQKVQVEPESGRQEVGFKKKRFSERFSESPPAHRLPGVQ